MEAGSQMTAKTAPMPRDLVIAAAQMFLPDDGTNWPAKCEEAMVYFENTGLPIGAYAINEPTQIAMHAFEKMGREYMETNKKWRQRLSEISGARFVAATRHYYE